MSRQIDIKSAITILSEYANTQSVLVVEDDEDANLFITKTLSKYYAHIDNAFDGAQALNLLNKNQYDIVVTDINMPNVNGIELVRKIKEENYNQKVVFISATCDAKTMQDCIRAGANDFIFKPVDLKEFLIVLGRLSREIAYEKHLILQEKKSTQMNKQQTLLYNINSMLINNYSQNEILIKLCEILVTYSNFSLSWICELHQNTLQMRFMQYCKTPNFTNIELSNAITQIISFDNCLQTISGNSVVVATTVEPDVKISENINIGEFVDKKYACIPIYNYNKHQVFAVLVVHALLDSGFDDDEIKLLQSIAYQIGNTITEKTKTKDLLHAIEKSNRLKWLILDGMTNGIIVFKYNSDIDNFQITSVNLFAYKSESLTLHDMLGKLVTDIFHGSVLEDLVCALKKVYNCGAKEKISLKVFDNESLKSWKDGYVYKLETSEIVLIYEDVTALKQSEISSEAKSMFLANMSHEIRTPLNSIVLATTLLNNLNADVKLSRYIKTIMSSSQSLLALINDILDFSKIEAKKLDLEISEFNLDSVLDELDEVFTLKVHDKNLEFIFMIDYRLPAIFYGDKHRLKQILFNFVSNAIKFTKVGKISVDIRLIETIEDKCYVDFIVQDSGIGIKDDQRHKLFHPFEQADISTTREYGGTGLGLSINSNLAKLMGGFVGVESSEGKGSKFFIRLPLEQQVNYCISNIFTKRAFLIIYDNRDFNEYVENCLLMHGATCDSIYIYNNCEIENIEKYQNILFLIKNETILRQSHYYNMALFNAKSIIFNASRVEDSSNLKLKTRNQSISRDRLIEYITSFDLENKEKHINKKPKQDKILNLNIAIVDDIEVNIFVLSELLKECGANVKSFTSGMSLIEYLQGGKNVDFDLILLDLQMPIMDGFDTAKKIYELGLKNFNIYALSADITNETRRKISANHFDGYLSKPINLDILMSTIAGKTINIQPTTNENIENLPILDYEKGLAMVSGNEQAYFKALQKFKTSFCGFSKVVNDLYRARDLTAIGTQMHALKGVSGNLGMDMLYDFLRKQNKHDICLEYIDSVEQILNTTLEEIDKIHINKKEDEGVKNSDVSIQELNKLKVLICAFNVEAKEFANSLYNSLDNNLEIKDSLSKVCLCLDEYDFDCAQTIVEGLMNERS